MITVSKAIEIVARETAVLGTEDIALSASVGRILAEPVVADSDMPPFDRSQMDGYAVIAADTTNAPVTLKLVGESAAGRGWHHKLSPGEAIAIMTGAPVPAGADAVQKIELTRSTEDAVEILEPTETSRYIVKRGSEITSGETLIGPGEAISERTIAVLAAFGYANVSVGKLPRVAILGTGSEIVEIAETPGRDQIRNSNSVMLEAMARRVGASVTVLPNAADDLPSLRSTIAAAAEFDAIILTGGVSVGKYDLTKLAISELGAEVFFEKVRLKPGKPAVFARLGTSLVFGLPGNPVSAAVTFHLFVRPALLKMQNCTETAAKRGYAVTAGVVRAAKERETYLPARLSTDPNGRLVAEPLRWQGSSDFVGFSRADVLIVAERGNSHEAGSVVPVEYL